MSTSWSPRNFDQVRRGYAPQQVDETFAALVRDLTTLRDQRDAIARQLAEAESRTSWAVAEAEQQSTYRGIGDRIERILRLAEEEADDLRSSTAAEIDRDRGLADQQIDRIREQADTYAKERRAQADAEAMSIIESARREANALREDAERTSRARRDEAENLFEKNRGVAAQAAADFEITLSRRRDQAERDFTSRMEAVEAQLVANEQRSEALRLETEELRLASERKATQVLEAAHAQADDLVQEATARSARMHAETEREVASMVQRRDSINQQLTNVRQMLATLTGSPPPIDPIGSLGEPEVETEEVADDGVAVETEEVADDGVAVETEDDTAAAVTGAGDEPTNSGEDDTASAPVAVPEDTSATDAPPAARTRRRTR